MIQHVSLDLNHMIIKDFCSLLGKKYMALMFQLLGNMAVYLMTQTPQCNPVNIQKCLTVRIDFQLRIILNYAIYIYIYI